MGFQISSSGEIGGEVPLPSAIQQRDALASPLSGSFAGGMMRVVEISAALLTATHRERLTVGRRGPMTLVAGEDGRVVLNVRVARSSFVQIEGEMGYRSVFEILDESIETAASIVMARTRAISTPGS